MNGGRIIFQGTVGEAEKLFTSIGLSCPSTYNPAEFYVNVICDTQKSSKVVNYLASVKGKEEEKENEMEVKNDENKEISISSNFRTLPWIHQCRIISHRAILNFLRAPTHYLIELLILIVS